MLNQTVMVGRLTHDLKRELIDDNREVCQITISVPRNYKNENGEYETDYIPVIITDNISKNVCEYCKKNDVIGIKGRIESVKENDNYNVRIIAEKVTFLSSGKEADKFE